MAAPDCDPGPSRSPTRLDAATRLGFPVAGLFGDAGMFSPFVHLGAWGSDGTEGIDLKRLPAQPQRLADCSSLFQCRNRLDLLSELLPGAFKVVPLLQIEPEIGTVSAQLPEP
jgi:hypothetical protein